MTILKDVDDMNKVIKLFSDTFMVDKVGCPWGSCKDDFLLNKAIETIEKSELNTQDKDNLIKLFNENMYHSLGMFSNGKGAGKWYIGIIEEYFNNNIKE